MKPLCTAFCLVCLFMSAAAAADDPAGLTTRETFALIEGQRGSVLFIDVRDPVEIMFTGFTDAVDRNIPFLLVDRTRWDAERNIFPMDPNPNFAAEVDAALQAKGLDLSATVITMCRSGSARGLPSARFLREHGFPNATFVIHGFQGDRATDGPSTGRRVVNGWVNDGLPWTTKANPAKLHRPVTPDVDADDNHTWLVIITSERAATQSMAIILSRAERERDTPVRILLCDEAGYLAVRASSLDDARAATTESRPRDLLRSLLAHGADVQVCGIFLPTSELTADDLLPGVTAATPNAISAQMSDAGTKVFVF